MGTYTNIKDEVEKNHDNKAIVPARRSLLLTVAAFLILALLVTAIVYQRYTNLRHDKQDEALNIANNARVRLQESLTYSLSATKTLSFCIQNDGSVRNFDSIAKQILESSKYIDALQLVPAGIIKHVYPPGANEKALNYNILQDPARNKEAFRAIEKKAMVFAGPFELKQGGIGVVGRLPIFRNNKFWGFSAVVIHMQTLLRSAGMTASDNHDYFFQLSKIDPGTGKEEFFLPQRTDQSDSYAVSLNVPDAEWKLSVIPVKAFDGYDDLLVLGILGLLLSVFGALVVFNISRKPKKLDQLVKVRTQQLKESEENYKLLFERSPLPLWIYDMDTFKFLEVNDAAINLYGYSREEFLYMDVFAIRPKNDIERFLEDNENVSEELREAGVWTHLKKNREQIQVLVFSRTIAYKGSKGRLILLMDVSEKVKIENELIKSEEKYRSLIEQASDGIILYSFDGTIHSYNKAAYTQTGYTEEEFEQLNLKDLFFEDIRQGNRQKDIKRDPGQTSILNRKLKRKDGSELQVELNTRMLPDGKIIAIVRDVSEREKTEAALKESEEKFSKAFHSNILGFAIYDDDFRIVDVNETYAAMQGATREQLLGKDAYESGLIHEVNDESRTALRKKIKEMLRLEGHLQNFEAEVDTLDGRKITMLLSIEPLELNDKHHWITSAIDISFKKEAEISLFKSEEKYRTLVDQASDGIFIADKTGRFIIVNPSGLAMSQYAEEELMNMTIYDLAVPEDILKEPFRFDEMKNSNVARTERRMRRKDGTLLDVEVTAKFISGERFLAFIRDITERKKNEDILRYQASLLDGVSDAITSLDPNRCIVSWNQASEELYGFTTEEVIGKRIPELVTFEFPNSTPDDVFKQVYATGKWKGEFNFIHPKTTIKTYLLSSISLLKNKDGETTGLIITSRDITDRKKAEEEANKSNERFELIAQATNDAVWDHDFVKNITWGNQKLYNLYGFEQGKQNINLELFLSRIHPDERAGIEKRMNEALDRKETTLSEEFRFKTASGVLRTFYDRAYIKYDADGNPMKILGAMQDITDKEQIRQQILKEKELSDSIINSLPGVFYLYTKEGKFLRWNKNFEKVSGYTGEEISHMHPLDFFDKKDKELLAEKIANVFVAGEDHVEADFLLKNGQMILYYFTGQSIEYEGQTCLMGVGLDFSEKEKAAKIIRESEEKYRTIIEQAADGIFLAGQDAYIVDVNSAGCRMLGYTKEELQKKTYTSLVPEEDLISNPVMIDKMGKGGTVVNERRLVRKDGSYIDVEISAKILFDGRFQSIVRDITERKKADRALRESEERYRALVENAPEALVVFSLEKRVFVSVSESAAKLFRMSKEELLKVGPVEVSPEYQPDGKLSADAIMENLGKTINGEKPSFEWTHKDKLGNLIPCEVWLVRLPSESGVLIRGSIVDITERKKVAEELRTNSELLRELYSYSQNIREEERTYIAREIHDELGQQLTGLKMDLSWINRKIKGADVAINEKLSGTLNLIDTTIKTVRKIATELRPSILDDLGLVAALEWQGEEFEKRSAVKVNFKSNLKETILKPDITTALFRIYQELLTNIARHANASLVNTSIYIENNTVHLDVDDNGTGFDIDNIVNKKTLGLRGIKERTSLIGGIYEIKSKPGEGTFVLISVPL